MTDHTTSGTPTSGSPMFAARDARLTPESVSERTFTQVKRGYAESEVRAFLRMVADDLQALRNRDRDLATRLQELEDRLARPTAPLSDQDLIAQLGEETARVLGQARDAAVDLRNKAEEHARKVVREAQESARDLRNSTQQAVEAKTREAEDSARARAREIVAEARSMRERVLTDLNERRTDLERQIGELRSNRTRLVDVYAVVERALAQAQRTIADEPPLPAATAPVVEPEPSDDEDDDGDAPADDATPSPTPTADTPASDDEARDVGALFERLRSESEGDESAAGADDTNARDAGSDTTTATQVPEAAADDDDVLFGDDQTEVVVGVVVEEDEADDAALGARDAALAPVAEDLAHRAKRALQDEQNDMLDGLRRQRGKIDASKVLPPSEDQLSRWAHVLQPSVDQAYAAGAAAMAQAAGDAATDAGALAVPGPLLGELAGIVVSPLRARLEASLESIDAKSPADVEIAVAQRLGARYREWRSQGLEDALGDALAVAYTQGAYDAAPGGSRLRWVPARVGKCPDCDDNALEPTVKGEEFPTGQLHPPAHPGCRCLVVLATD